jgi:hypothetical protein
MDDQTDPDQMASAASQAPENEPQANAYGRRALVLGAAAGVVAGVAAAGGIGVAQAQGTPTVPATSSPPNPTLLNDLITNFQSLNGGTSTNEVQILRMVVTNSTFRAAFTSNPATAIQSTGLSISPNQLAALSRINPTQVSVLQNGINNIAVDGTTDTLAYAIVLAVVIAVLIAMPGVD